MPVKDVRYAVLLRGVNLGGQRKVPMADLRRMLEGLGYADVITHLQSGNAAVTTTVEPQSLVRDVERALRREFGFNVDVVVRTHRELASVLKRSPLGNPPPEPAKYLVSFLADKPDRARVDKIEATAYAPDEVWVDGKHVYMWCPNGVGRSKVPKDFFAKALGVSATARNWNTITKMLDLTRG